FEATSVDALKEALEMVSEMELRLFILGGGSNILFTSHFDGAIIHPAIDGIEVVSEDDLSVVIKVGAGVEWDSLVEHVVNKGLGGLENLSLIPGNVGASPIQNIGAYGVEVKDCIEKVEGIYISSLKPFALSKDECNFGYRDSIFKNDLKGKVVVTHVTYKLSKNPVLITHYGNLDSELEKLGGKTLATVRQAVINVRNSKLPDPAVLGNAGSFFKNPMVDISVVEELQKDYEKVPFYPVSESYVKLPAGWLIEQCGWKGKKYGNVGVHKDQALVIVNYGGANGKEVIDLAHKVRHSVMEKFNVSLEMEVNVV
ncbi:MAG: UDP-N-acetylenolpyruvoylglucosamine reductase, partial [Bacteroidetes bacterium HGW-Bacteroidetes-15]